MLVCPNCGAQHPDGATFCDSCGAALTGGTPAAATTVVSAQPAFAAGTCPTCGAPVTPGEAFCDNCGAALDTGSLGSTPQPTISIPQFSPAPPSAAAMVCPECGAPLEPGSNFCDMCGAQVGAAALSTPPPPTPTVPAPTPATPVPPQVVQPPMPPTPQPAYPPVATVQGRFVVQNTNATLPIPSGKAEIIIGREDPVSGIFPDIDLTDHGGDEGGVSRRHARIFVQGTQLLIEDLNSTNYTYVNHQKLGPGQPHPLNNGDEVRFGRVKLNFYSV